MANRFIEKYSEEFSKSLKEFDKKAIKVILSYTWPGNVRELENKIKRAVILSEKLKITADNLEIELEDHTDQ